MTAFVGLLKFKGTKKLSGEEQLAAGRAARAMAELHGQAGRFLSILWAEGDYDLVLTLEAKNEAIAKNVFKALEEHVNATISSSKALIMWEKERLVQGKTI